MTSTRSTEKWLWRRLDLERLSQLLNGHPSVLSRELLQLPLYKVSSLSHAGRAATSSLGSFDPNSSLSPLSEGPAAPFGQAFSTKKQVFIALGLAVPLRSDAAIFGVVRRRVQTALFYCLDRLAPA